MTITRKILEEMISEYNAERFTQAIAKLEKNENEANKHGHTAFTIADFIKKIAEENNIEITTYIKEMDCFNENNFKWDKIKVKQIQAILD